MIEDDSLTERLQAFIYLVLERSEENGKKFDKYLIDTIFL